MLNNYQNLLNSIENWLARNDLIADNVAPDLVSLCERELKNRLRVKEMELRFPFRATSQFSTLPSDFLEAREVRIFGNRDVLSYMTPQKLEEVFNRGGNETPCFFTIRGSEIQFNSIPSFKTSQTVSSATRVGTTVTITTALDHGIEVGDSVTVSGAVETAYNGTFTVTTVPTTTTFQYEALTVPSASPATGTVIYIVNNVEISYWAFPTALSFQTNVSVSTLTSVGTLCTMTTATAHGLQVGDPIIVSGAVETAYNGNFLVNSVLSTVQFTYVALATPSASPATGTITVTIGNDTNTILTNYPDIYLFGSIKEAVSYTQDAAQLQVFDGRFDIALKKANDFSSASTHTGSILQMKI